jgi:glycosyltransferase involved in cell wall biosynthesis
VKIKILFVYPGLFTGGSTSSLISLLNSLDYNIYEIHLITYTDTKFLPNSIPTKVIIHNAVIGKNKKIHRLIKYILNGTLVKALYYEFKYYKRIGFNHQVLSNALSSNNKEMHEKFDVVIGYLELWSNAYAIKKTSSKVKITWIHTDYKNSKLIPKLDFETFGKADYIITVSKDCKTSFNDVFPMYEHKTMVIENITSKSNIVNKSKALIDNSLISGDSFKLVTTCRLVIATKGLDRIVNAAKFLSYKGYDFKWYIIGDGPDKMELLNLINKELVIDKVILLGNKENPYPYMKQCDVFVLPSRFEGKPISVTEAQILGLPVIVTNYSSASEQVKNMIDGIIIENEDNVLAEAVEKLILDPQLVNSFSDAIKIRDLGNENEVIKLNKLLVHALNNKMIK